MLVQLQHGSRVGEVHDFPPHEALAMLADGRAVRPSDPAACSPVSVPSLHAREDRGMPRGKRRATR